MFQPILALTLATATGACVADGEGNAPPPRAIQPAPQQPPGIVPTDLELVASRFAQDSDKNGFADQISATVYLFAPARYQSAVAAEGRLVFELTTPQPGGAPAVPLARWEFDEPAVAAARQQFLPGPGFAFKLSLLDAASGATTDRIAPTDAQLRATFTPTGNDAPDAGRPVASRSPIRVSLGRLRSPQPAPAPQQGPSLTNH